MKNLREKLHEAYKEKLSHIIFDCMFSAKDKSFEKDPMQWIRNWIDEQCSPMGDFDEDKAIKEIKSWKNK